MKHLLLLAALAAILSTNGVSAAPSTAQQESVRGRAPRFVRATDVEKLLPQSSVYSMLEDEQGFLWFATREGIARWDGYDVRSWLHDPFEEGTLPGNIVRSLVQDGSGDIWATTQNYLQRPSGLARLIAPDFRRVQRHGHPWAQVVLDATGAPLLVGTDSVYRWDPAQEHFTGIVARTGGRPGVITAALGADGALWIRPAGAGVERCDIAVPACEVLPVGPPQSTPRISNPIRVTSGETHVVRVTRGGDLYVGYGGGLFRMQLPEGTPSRELRATGDVVDVLDQPDGTLWALADNGVYRKSPDGEWSEPIPLPTVSDRPNLAPVSLLYDRSGTLWVGTVWGLYRYREGSDAFGHVGHDPANPNSLTEGLVVSLAEDRDGSVWVGTIGGGASQWDRQRGTFSHFWNEPGDPLAATAGVVWALAVDSTGGVWAGTGEGIVGRASPEEPFRPVWQGRRGPEGEYVPITDLRADGTGRVWVRCARQCDNMLTWFDVSSGVMRTRADDRIGSDGYQSIDTGRWLWIGTDRGVVRVDLHSVSLEGPLAVESVITGALDGVLSFYHAPDGDTWIGSNSGLFRIASDGTLRVRYTSENGLPSNTVYGILADEYGRLWLSTNRGLASLDPAAAPAGAVRTYDHTTGLVNVEYNRNAYMKARDGTMLFGGDLGITVFHPNDVVESPYRPPVVLTAVERSTASTTVRDDYVSDAPVRIAADEYSFTFEFAALSYVNPHLNRYAVRLEGFEDSWRELGTEHRATYTNLPPGDYVFRVRAASADGVWNDEGVAQAVIVEPSFWETLWFRSSVLLALVATVTAITWILSRARYRVHLATLQSERNLVEERDRIARDMHDEVGANLTEIAILSELAQHRGTDGGSEQVKRIGEKSRRTLDSIGEIVWAITPQNDDGDRFSAYLHEYAAELLESAHVECTLRFPPSGTLPRVRAEARRGVLLILKEALTNVVKHARPDHVTVTLQRADQTLRLTVHDDGLGFVPGAAPGEAPVAGSQSHNGLTNMAARARGLGGTLVIDSAPSEGTCLTLELPLPSVTAGSPGLPFGR